mgnify:CR=1 FL=1
MSSRIIVALSGGVDSAVAAWLLVRAGHEVEALHMTNWTEDEDGYCTAAEDWQSARSVGDALGIPVHRVSFAQEYRERVFADLDRKSTRLNSSHIPLSRMPSSA